MRLVPIILLAAVGCSETEEDPRTVVPGGTGKRRAAQAKQG